MLLLACSVFIGIADEMVSHHCCLPIGTVQITHEHPANQHAGCTTMNCSTGQAGLVRMGMPVTLGHQGENCPPAEVRTLESSRTTGIFRPPIRLS